jgi:serine/threonine protein kinase
MPEDPSLDPRRAVDHVSSPGSPSTVEETGACQPPGATGQYLPAPPAEAPIIPGYRITAEIARGGMGRVYAGHELTLDREVAIKTLLPGADAERFVTEARSTARLPHPGIPPVHALGTLADGTPYLAMKLIHGSTLAELLDKRPSPSHELPQFVQIFEQIAQAVGFAHAQGIIHRDLKPLNVMVGAFGEVQVMDWGLAKDVASGERERVAARPDAENVTQTAAGAVLGTPGYMAPEQARGEVVDAGADVFALGATLAAILTGQPAFMGASKREVIDRAARADLTDVRGRLTSSGADGELIGLALRCLSADVTERPIDGRAVAAEVAAYRAGVEARLMQAETERTEALVREAEQRKRRRTVQVAGGVIAVVLLAGLSVSLWQMFRAIDAEGQANENAQQARDEANAKLAAKERADRNFALARQAVEKTITQVAGHRRLKEADFHGLRKELLAAAVPFYEEFVRQQSDDPAVENDRGKALMELAYVRDEMGDKEAALADYGTALALFARLAEQFPAVPEYRQSAAKSYHDRGLLLDALGRRNEAENEYHAALALEKRLAEQFPDVPEYRFAVANSHNNLGLLLQNLGRLDESELEYRAALARQEKLVEQFPTMPDYRQELARSRMNLGNLLTDLGRRNDAEKEFRAALSRQEKLAEQFPAVPEYRQELALSHNNLGVLLGKLGQRSEEEKEYRAAITLQEKLAEQFAAVAAYRQALGRSHMNFGNLLRELGRRDEADEESRSALTLQEKLVEHFPTVPEYRHDLANSHNHRATQMHLQGRREEAEKEYRLALAHYEKLTEQFSAAPAYAVDLAASYVNFGALLREQGRVEDALAWYAKAMATLQGVLAIDQRHATARLYLRNAYFNRAQAWDQLHRYTDAVADWGRATELDEGPDRPYFRLQRAASLLRAGDHARAVTEANALTEGKDVPGPLYYDVACICARAAAAVKHNTKLTEQYAAHAVALLRQAVAKGYKDIEHLKKNDDLKWLRQREDFQKLVKELGDKGT